MKPIPSSDRLVKVHSDIRGPVFVEAMKMRAEGIDVLRLNTGNPGSFGFGMPDSIKNALLQNVDKAVPYCDLKGMPEARQAICKYHQGKGIQGITPDDIFIGNGVSEVASMLVSATLNAGDEILLPMPSYSMWPNLTYIAEATPVLYRCDEESLWYPDLADIRSKITPKTRAIVIINPNNPTGALYPREILEGIIDIAREHDLMIFSDEIYDRLVMDDLEHISTASLAPDVPIVTFNGLSKSHIVCGFRCGWLVVSGPRELTKDLIATLTKLAALRLCGGALTQLVIPAALEDNESTRAMLVPGGRLYEQREAVFRKINDIPGVSCVKNSATFYIFPKLDAKRFNLKDDRQFAMDLLHQKHILLVPGSGFDWPEPDHCRIIMLPEAEALSKAIDDIADFLSTYRQ